MRDIEAYFRVTPHFAQHLVTQQYEFRTLISSPIPTSNNIDIQKSCSITPITTGYVTPSQSFAAGAKCRKKTKFQQKWNYCDSYCQNKFRVSDK